MRGITERWHVDKGIPVALMLTIFVTLITSIASGAWVAARTTARIDRLEERIAEQTTFRDDITTLKEQMKYLTRLIEREVEQRRSSLEEKGDKVLGRRVE